MKAPDRPNKIYVPVVTSELTNLEYIRYDLASTKPTTYSRDHIEYIKKDALIDMLKGYSHPLTRVVVQEVIDKLNSL